MQMPLRSWLCCMVVFKAERTPMHKLLVNLFPDAGALVARFSVTPQGGPSDAHQVHAAGW